ncbi:hypothetical protein APR04_000714 [Promicromonospora umidemergens]|uniref:Winged helix DNA-binding protein n=1 Tax=Promicromonospora umidemergens TaxID=629679 RepID=A0ABP8XRA1_9MICO|nr:hypothetical protein [Promicromonospora umidemergens]MCP2281819.1 hypothetical protein [Promicromonospora umidemergens]
MESTTEETRPELRHASELYARLLEYATSPPFAERTAANVRRLAQMHGPREPGTCTHHHGDRRVLQAVAQIVFDVPPYGMRLIDRYADWSADLTDQDRRLLEAWRTGGAHCVFEILRRTGAGVRARCLGDDLEYTLYADPRTPLGRADLRTGRYVAGHVLPVGDAWMLAGDIDVYAARERQAMLGLMAELVRGAPALPFRNPAIVEQARATLQVQHRKFLRLFGRNGAPVSGARLVDLLDELWESSELWDAWWPGLSLERDLCDLREALDQPWPDGEPRPDGGTWYPVHDPVHGLRLLAAPYGMLGKLHRSTAPVDASAVREVSALLDAGQVPDFALRDLAERHPVRAGEIYRAALGRPGFTWVGEGAAWLKDRAGDGPVHPALVWLPGRTAPAGSGKPDRSILVPHPLVVTFPPLPAMPGT